MLRKYEAVLRLISASAAAVALTLTGCHGGKSAQNGAIKAGGAGNKIKIGFLVKQPEEAWFQNEWVFAQKCADKNSFELLKYGATDGEAVLTRIDTLATAGAQGFVICTPDVKLGPAIVRKAQSAGLKVYSVDDQFLGADGKPMMDVPYMGISAKAIGESVGKALADEMKRRGWKLEETAACAITYDELPTAKDRTDGATAALVAAGFPADRIFRSHERTTDVPGSFEAANTLITQHSGVKKWLVFSMNDEGVLGAVRALEGRGFGAETVAAIGIGGTTAFAELSKPKLTGFIGTALISPRRHGYETTENLYKWIKDGVKPPMDVRTVGIIVTRDNYKKVAKEQGLL